MHIGLRQLTVTNVMRQIASDTHPRLPKLSTVRKVIREQFGLKYRKVSGADIRYHDE